MAEQKQPTKPQEDQTKKYVDEEGCVMGYLFWELSLERASCFNFLIQEWGQEFVMVTDTSGVSALMLVNDDDSDMMPSICRILGIDRKVRVKIVASRVVYVDF